MLLQFTLLGFAGKTAEVGDYLRRWHNFKRLGTAILAAVMISEQLFSIFLVDSGGSCLCFPLLVEEKVVRVCGQQEPHSLKKLLGCPRGYSWTVALVTGELTTQYKPVNLIQQ